MEILKIVQLGFFICILILIFSPNCLDAIGLGKEVLCEIPKQLKEEKQKQDKLAKWQYTKQGELIDLNHYRKGKAI